MAWRWGAFLYPATESERAPEGHQEFDRAGRRHPLDPDPVPATKAQAVRWLAIVALAFSPVLAGVVPAVVALVMARETVEQMRASGGFLTGTGPLLSGVRLVRLALLVSVAVVVIGVAVALLRLGGSPSGGVHYGPGVN